jgi:acyl-CoA synthetase (AMP-forming)/AMP-acid ligase II
MLGYLNMPGQTAETLVNGWVASGDAGYMDDDGYLYLVDRVKDMIISGGENIFSVEVESAVSTHPAILDVAVIGIPDENWGEAVHGIVILKPGQSTSEQEIIEHCKKQITGYKCPKSVEFRTEPFPLSAAGKTLKVDMRKPYWAGKERSIN